MPVTTSIQQEGQLASSLGDIFTASGSCQLTVTLFNTSVILQQGFLYLQKASGTQRKVRAFQLSQNWSCEWRGVRMGVGDKIRAVTTTAAVVDFTVEGVFK